MKLGFHYHIPALRKNNAIYMLGYLGVFIDSLAEYCEHIVCFMHNPLEEELEKLGYQIKSNNVILVNIGPHSSVPNRLLHSAGTRKKILAWKDKIDLMLVRTPTILIPIFSKKFPVPIALLIVGDYLSGIDQLPQRFWRKEIIRLLLKWNNKHQMVITKKSLVFTNSELLYQKLKPIAKKLIQVQTTTLSAKDIYIRNDTCQNKRVNLLFVGRYDRAKGLFELYEALAQLKKSGNNYHLYLVGWPEKGDTILEELNDFADELSTSHMITNLGYKELGPELFDVYKSADMFVMPTKFDAFPRTITEAMAHSLPVVLTKVGSIPIRLTNGSDAILVEPADSEALADAIDMVANNRELRQKLIKNGRELASQNTLEIQSKIMINEMERYITK